MTSTNRTAEVTRKTGETDIRIRIDLDGQGRGNIATGVEFFDHMLNSLARHSLIDLDVQATGDLGVDAHHTVEDVGIVLGQAIDKALADRAGMRRYGSASVPMDEALASVALDIGGRPYLVYQARFATERVGSFDIELIREFLLALATHLKANLHVDVPYGANSHHIAEAVFKALAVALRQAVERDPRRSDVPSTKGQL
jgi:imidazoleglycerol-phosphate dehydratase